MDEETLAAIRQRADAAMPGPWEAWEATRSDTGDLVAVHVGDEYWSPNSYDYQPGSPISERRGLAMRDAEFIAHARDDIPALLAEVDAWREIGRVLAADGIWLSEHWTLQQKARALLGTTATDDPPG